MSFDFSIDLELYQNAEANHISLLKLYGPLNQHSVPVLEAKIKEHYQKGICCLVLDLSNTKYLNSTGLGLLINLARTVNLVGGGVRLINMAEKFKFLLDMLCLENSLPLCENKQEALQSFGKGEVEKISEDLSLLPDRESELKHIPPSPPGPTKRLSSLNIKKNHPTPEGGSTPAKESLEEPKKQESQEAQPEKPKSLKELMATEESATDEEPEELAKPKKLWENSEKAPVSNLTSQQPQVFAKNMTFEGPLVDEEEEITEEEETQEQTSEPQPEEKPKKATLFPPASSTTKFLKIKTTRPDAPESSSALFPRSEQKNSRSHVISLRYFPQMLPYQTYQWQVCCQAKEKTKIKLSLPGCLSVPTETELTPGSDCCSFWVTPLTRGKVAGWLEVEEKKCALDFSYHILPLLKGWRWLVLAALCLFLAFFAGASLGEFSGTALLVLGGGSLVVAMGQFLMKRETFEEITRIC